MKVRAKQRQVFQETLQASSNKLAATSALPLGNLSLKQTWTDVPPSPPDGFEGGVGRVGRASVTPVTSWRTPAAVKQ